MTRARAAARLRPPAAPAGSRARLAAAAAAVIGPALVTLLAFTDTRSLIPGLLYVLAVAGAASLGGIWFGVAAAVIAFAPFDYFFTGTAGGFSASVRDAVAGFVFLLTGLGAGFLIERERRARAAAEAARETAVLAARDAARLQRAAEALTVAAAPQQVLDAVLTEGVAAAEARAGLIALLSEDGSTLKVVAGRGYAEGSMGEWRASPVDADDPLSFAVRTGEPVFVSSERERLGRFPALGRTGEDTHALVCLALTVEDRTIGGLLFSFAEDQDFPPERRALKLALARQAAQALERAQLYDKLRKAEARTAFLAEATRVLSASLDYEQTLQRLAEIAVPTLADGCTVDVLEDGGQVKRVAVAHEDAEQAARISEIGCRLPHDQAGPRGVAAVIRSGAPEFLPEVARELPDEAVGLPVGSWICVPLQAHDRVLGALSLLGAPPRPPFTETDLALAAAVADRAAVAIENSLLYREAERRGDAALALTYVGDGVVLVDSDDIVRYWNRSAEIVLGRSEGEAVGRRPAELVAGWPALHEHIEPADAAAAGQTARARTVPLTVRGEERWLSVAAVDFGDGCVYALRDVSDERALEQARSEFVATASHELRTPLTSVYGAIRTLRREDVVLSPESAGTLLEIIEHETERLNVIVGQLLVAGQLESGSLRLAEADVELPELAADVIRAARLRAPAGVEIALHVADELPKLRCDDDKLRQVLVNLVENAIKYSPDGGEVCVSISTAHDHVRIDVSDQGLGIAPADRERIFEKFARLDPALRRGVGGSGLGLYIARELTSRMGGRIAVESAPGAGSTFTVELPLEPVPVTA